MPLVDWGLIALGEQECRRLLASGSLGRVGLTVKCLPVILPVNYVVVDGKVAFWSAPGLKLDAARWETVVAFEVEGSESDGSHPWSVLVVGKTREVEDPAVIDRVVASGLHPRPRGDRHHLIELDTEFISGRRVGLPPYQPV